MPLILHASFLKCKELKEFCQILLKCFDITNSIKWNLSILKSTSIIKTNSGTKTKYIKNPNRSAQLFCDYLKCIKIVKSQLEQDCDETFIEKGANRLEKWINNEMKDDYIIYISMFTV